MLYLYYIVSEARLPEGLVYKAYSTINHYLTEQNRTGDRDSINGPAAAAAAVAGGSGGRSCHAGEVWSNRACQRLIVWMAVSC